MRNIRARAKETVRETEREKNRISCLSKGIIKWLVNNWLPTAFKSCSIPHFDKLSVCVCVCVCAKHRYV